MSMPSYNVLISKISWLTIKSVIIATAVASAFFAHTIYASQVEGIAPETVTEKNYALYTFTNAGRGGMHHGYNAGSYVTLEVTEDPLNKNIIIFKISNLIPEPHSRIGSIGFDLGRYRDLFVRLETDKALKEYYKVRRLLQEPFTHAFWPNFNAHYYIPFVIDPKIAKPNDPRKLSPGMSLTINAVIPNHVRYEHVIQALNHGLHSHDGLRIGIIGLHLAGKPSPSGTRMDDGGYFTGRLVRSSGPHAKNMSSEKAPPNTNLLNTEPARGGESMSSDTSKAPETKSVQESRSSPSTSDSPWCRFCPISEPQNK